MRRIIKTATAALVIIILLTAVSACGRNSRPADSPSPDNAQPPFISFRDIPGITAEEIAAIEALQQSALPNAPRTFSYGMTLTTESFLKENGESEDAVGGYAALLCRWFGSLFGIQFQPEIYAWDDLLEKLNNGTLDFAGNLIITEERKKMYYMTDAIAKRQYKMIRLKGSPVIEEIEIERPLRYAFLMGAVHGPNVAAVTNPDTYEPVWVHNYAEVYHVLENGEADAFIAEDSAEAYFSAYDNIYFEDFLPLIFSSIGMATAKAELEPVISVITKALSGGATSYLSHLFNQGYEAYKKHAFYTLLNEEEKEYLRNNVTVPLLYQYFAYPLAFYDDKSKKWDGIGLDVLREVEKISGLTFKIVNDERTDMGELVSMLSSGKGHMLCEMIMTKEREPYFIWNKNRIMIDQYALLSKTSFPNVNTNEISNARIALTKNTAHTQMFRIWFPDAVSITEFANEDESFVALEKGKVDMVMASKGKLLYYANYFDFSGYKANYLFNHYYNSTFAYNKDQTVLCSIVDKALSIVNVNVITEQWVAKTYDYRRKVLEARLPWLIGAVALSLITSVLILILFYRSRNLRKRKDAEAKMRAADERAQIIFDTAPLASCMFDKDFHIFDCNQETVKMFGIPDKAFFLNNFFELFPEYQFNGKLSSDEANRNISIAFEKGINRFELMHRKLNGESLPIEVTLVRVKYRDEYVIASYMRDLTEQKAAEELTKIVMEKTSTLTTILDTTPDLIFCKDFDSRYTLCNKSFENLVNIPREDIIGKNDAEGLKTPPEVAAEFLAEDKRVFDEKQVIMFEDYLLSHDGTRILFETIKAPLVVDGKVTGLVGISRDITQRRKLVRQQAEAEAANRAKSLFLATMSHEMRTPMNAIIGMTAIGKNSNDIERKDYALYKIEDAAAHLLGVINDVLDISKIEANKLELTLDEFDFERMLEKIVNIINFRMDEKHQKFMLNVDQKIPQFVVGDEHRFGQVIMNLLSNAVKFSPENGEIGLDITLVNEKDGICEIRTEVSDNGIGIPPEQKERLFRAFQQADSGISREFGGTGLGLSISKHIVELMGGTIGLESEYGKGSRFVFTVKLERSAKEVDSGCVKESPELLDAVGEEDAPIDMVGRFAEKKLLVAEDVEINREIIISLLEDTGIHIDCAQNGLEAVEMIIAAPDKYDAILMDVQMPKMDGLEATRLIRSMNNPRLMNIPIIAMTAHVFKSDIEECLKAGMNDHIGKPIDIEDVKEKLHKYLCMGK